MNELLEKKKKLQEKLKKINEKVSEQETALTGALDDGTYKYKDIIAEVSTKVTKGRTSVSWKGVSESVKEELSLSFTELIKKKPDWKKPITKAAKILESKYLKSLELNTKVGAESEKRSIKISILS